MVEGLLARTGEERCTRSATGTCAKRARRALGEKRPSTHETSRLRLRCRAAVARARYSGPPGRDTRPDGWLAEAGEAPICLQQRPESDNSEKLQAWAESAGELEHSQADVARASWRPRGSGDAAEAGGGQAGGVEVSVWRSSGGGWCDPLARRRRARGDGCLPLRRARGQTDAKEGERKRACWSRAVWWKRAVRWSVRQDSRLFFGGPVWSCLYVGCDLRAGDPEKASSMSSRELMDISERGRGGGARGRVEGWRFYRRSRGRG